MTTHVSAAMKAPPAGVDADGERCPMCEQPIPHQLSEKVNARIRAHEHEHQVELETVLARTRAEAEGQARTEIAAARAEALKLAEQAASAKLQELMAAKSAADQEIAALKAGQEAAVARRIAEIRETLDKERISAIQAEQTKAFEEKQRFQSKILELQRQLENKTAQELGDGPEVDLFELLKSEFPEDRISRVEKGASGADVVHDIYLNGRMCGRIVYDSKNRSAWRNDYVTKLRADQIEAKADHAVLCSKVFPSGVRELHLQDGVLVVAPPRLMVLAQLLRKHVVQTHALRSGNEARAQKTEALYAFIMSDHCGQLLTSIERQADDLVDLDRREERTHQATWKRRGEIIRTLQRSHGELTFEIDRIIGVGGNSPPGRDAK